MNKPALQETPIDETPIQSPEVAPPFQMVTTSVAAPVQTPPQYVAPISPVAQSRGGLIPLHARIDPALSRALMKAAFVRRMNNITPFHQQEIVGEALADWLRKHGFLS